MGQWQFVGALLDVNLAAPTQVNPVHCWNRKAAGAETGRLSSVESEDSKLTIEGRILIATHPVCPMVPLGAREKTTLSSDCNVRHQVNIPHSRNVGKCCTVGTEI